MEGFDEEKTDPEKIGSNDNIIRKGKHCLIAGKQEFSKIIPSIATFRQENFLIANHFTTTMTEDWLPNLKCAWTHKS